MAASDASLDFDEFSKITEGKATILFPKNNEVFYNPVQQFNRDMSIAVIRQWAQDQRRDIKQKRSRGTTESAAAKVSSVASCASGGTDKEVKATDMKQETSNEPKFRILEALAASGLRSLRYVLEMPDIIDHVVANDMSSDAVLSIERNMKFNNIPANTLLRPRQSDAVDLLYAHRHQPFHVIDLDPYGTASPFLDGAIQAVTDGGLLCITCTDMISLAGNQPDSCFVKYGGVPLKSDFCHEMAVRLVLYALKTTAARYRRHIVPLVSLSIDFYVRIFVRVYNSPSGCQSGIRFV
jgi:tRNA (guanine26-N2/guanine27-N2)-dimethyltransferase